MPMTDYFATHAPAISQEIKDFFAERRRAARELSPNLEQSIDILEDFTLRGGKQIRPMLVLLGYELAGGKINKAAYQVAAAVEIFHKHILNLDDMADRDEMRYNGPTIWKKYEAVFEGWKDAQHHARSFAEIDGTLLGSFAFDLVRRAQLPAEIKLAVMDVLINRMYFETVAGWQIHYHQNQESLEAANEEVFIKGLDLVTARYTFVGPLKIGLILAGKTPSKLRKAVESYAMKVGLAFQITDDILGVFGDPKETGKSVGNDIREGKKTLLLQRAYQAAQSADQEFLADVCGRELRPQELERAQQIIRDTGSLEYSLQLAHQQITVASQDLQAVQLSGKTAEEARSVLRELAEFIRQRKK